MQKRRQRLHSNLGLTLKSAQQQKYTIWLPANQYILVFTLKKEALPSIFFLLIFKKEICIIDLVDTPFTYHLSHHPLTTVFA